MGVAVASDLFRSLDELAKDYDSKGAERLVSSLSVAEIRLALGRLQSLPKDSPLRAQLFRAWAAKEPEAAWEAALALSEKEGRATCLVAVAGEIAKTRPEAAVDLAMLLGMGSTRQFAVNAAIREWAKAHLPSTLNYLKRNPNLLQDNYTLVEAIEQIARDDPMRAAQQAVMLPTQNQRENAIQLALRQWYAQDAAAAKRWALDQTDLDMRTAALKSLIFPMADDNPRNALAFISQTEFSEREDAQTTILGTWLAKDPAAVFEYLAANPQFKRSDGLTEMISSVLTKTSPEDQARLLSKLPEVDLKHQFIRQMANIEIHRGRYAKAVAALNALPDSFSRDSSLEQLGTSWAKYDPQAAAAWLKLQPDSTDRDLVIGGYATTLAQTEPQAAIQWAKAIPDPGIQKSVFKNIAVKWLQANPQAAMPWLESLNLPQAEKNDLIYTARRSSNTTYPINVQNRR